MAGDKLLPTSSWQPLDTTSKKTTKVKEGDENGYCLLPVLPVCFLTINAIIALFRAYEHKDVWMIIFVLFLYFGFISLFLCLSVFDRLPQHEQSPKKEWLKVAIWVLTTSLNLGLAIKFAPLIFPVARVFILAMAISTSVFGFYFFFIYTPSEHNNKNIKLPSEEPSKLLKQSSSVTKTTTDHEKINSIEPLNMEKKSRLRRMRGFTLLSFNGILVPLVVGFCCCRSKQHHCMDDHVQISIVSSEPLNKQTSSWLLPSNKAKNSDANVADSTVEEDNCSLPLLPVGFLTINSIIALVKAYDHKDLWMVVFVLFLYFGFMSLFLCLRAFDRLPQHEQSRKKECLKVSIWVLTTSLNLGLAIMFAPLIYPVARVFILAMAVTTSVCGFYFFFIYTDNEDHKKVKPSSFSSQPKIKESPVTDVKTKPLEPASEPLNIV